MAPIFFMVLLCLIQRIPVNEDDRNDRTLQIPKCKPGIENRCFSLLYTVDGGIESLNGAEIDQIMNQVAQDNGFTVNSVFNPDEKEGEDLIVKIGSPKELEDFVLNHPNVTQAAVIFNSNQSYAQSITTFPYNIMFNDTNDPSFNVKLDNAFVVFSIQKSIDAGIMSVLAQREGLGSIKAVINTMIKSFPAGNLIGFDAFQQLGNLFLYCALMFNFTVFLYQIVNEKSLQLRQGMRMIGLSDLAYWMSWFVTNIIFLLIYIGILMIVGYACSFPFFVRTNFAVHFLTFFLFGLSMMPLAYLLSMFLTTTKQAINIGMLIFVVGTILQIIFSIQFTLQYLYQSQYELRWVLQFYPPFNFSKLMYDIGRKANEATVRQLEKGDKSLLFNWSDLYEKSDFSGFSVPPPVHSYGYLMMNFGIFTLFSWYFYNILPSEKGNVPWFFLTKDYWHMGKDSDDKPSRSEDTEVTDSDVINEIKKAFEEDDAELRILNLHKKYTRFFGLKTTQHAVRGLSLSMRKGQVFALLGHNGAGKTTTISCITGAFRPTSGDALIYGKSLKHSLDQVQKIIGVCPQHNILFDELTAREHLEIYADIKGVKKSEQRQMIDERLNDVLLLDVAHKASGTFSGGMKRRLSVAISAIGYPKVIFLDEPTTGLDPLSRREIWSAIERLKKDRVIVLTTHSMEEADILGDTIAVMAKGKLRCIGTSLHLKNKFGMGYRLNLTTSNERHHELKSLVWNCLPGSELIAESGGFLVYGIKSKDIQQTIPFFKYIEDNKENPDFVVKDYGMSQTTLEEVFLSVTKSEDH